MESRVRLKTIFPLSSVVVVNLFCAAVVSVRWGVLLREDV